ncbi:MAG: STAS domain-containing protein [Paracoccus sp. (in: a-proteobacteria)]
MIALRREPFGSAIRNTCSDTRTLPTEFRKRRRKELRKSVSFRDLFLICDGFHKAFFKDRLLGKGCRSHLEVFAVLALTLPETLDRRTVAELSKSLLAHRGTNLMLDAAPVQRVTAEGLELLIAAACQWRVDGAEMDSRNWTDAAQADLANFGTVAEIFTAGPRT